MKIKPHEVGIALLAGILGGMIYGAFISGRIPFLTMDQVYELQENAEKKEIESIEKSEIRQLNAKLAASGGIVDSLRKQLREREKEFEQCTPIGGCPMVACLDLGPFQEEIEELKTKLNTCNVDFSNSNCEF